MNFTRLTFMSYRNNQVDLPIQILRFANRIRSSTVKKLNVYNDNQNIHNSNVQLSVKNSINNITMRNDLPKFDKNELIKIILNDGILDCQEQLLEYIDCDTEHSLIFLTFAEVLWFVIQTINRDFTENVQKEIKFILNQEIKDSLCKCFTGRLVRLINCLNGFSDLVEIHIHDSEQIGNIIHLIREKLGENYTV